MHQKSDLFYIQMNLFQISFPIKSTVEDWREKRGERREERGERREERGERRE